MLRLFALLLLLANAGYFAWSQGHLQALGWGPVNQREPERLGQQLAPEKLKVERQTATTTPVTTSSDAPTPTDKASSATAESTSPPAEPSPAPAGEATACYQAPGFSASQAQALRVVLSALPWAGGRWSLDEAVLPERWIVYMGRYADAEALARKKGELRQLGVEFRDATGLMPGLALGTYSTEAAALQAQAELVPRGVRTSRVVKEREEQRSLTLRFPAMTAAQRAEVQGLNSAMAGKTLAPC